MCPAYHAHSQRHTVTCSLATMYIHNTGDMFLKLVEALFGYVRFASIHMCVGGGLEWIKVNPIISKQSLTQDLEGLMRIESMNGTTPVMSHTMVVGMEHSFDTLTTSDLID